MKKLAILFIVLSACTTFSISPARASSLPGQVIKLVANQNNPIGWTASVGTITNDGVWTAPPCTSPLPIVATITATSGGNSASSQITVEDRVTGLSVTPSSATVNPGGTVTFRATVKTFCFPAGLATGTTSLPATLPMKLSTKLPK